MAMQDTITNLGNAIINLTNSKISAHSTAVEESLSDLKDTIDEIIEHSGSPGPGTAGIFYRNIGEIITSPIPLADAGLHLLDGSLISASGIYAGFVNYIASLYGDGTNIPNYFCTEEEWQAAVITYGVCGKFVYDSENNTVRLPKYSNKIWTSDVSEAAVIGNGMTLGLTDGVNVAGLYNGTNSQGWYWGNKQYQTLAGTPVATSTSSGSGYLKESASIGVTTDSTKSGLIADLSDITSSLDGYYYIVVATSTKTDIQVDIDEVVTDLNGKADVDLTNVPASKGILAESYALGTSWYRIYSDGWCVQGGHYTHDNVEKAVTTVLLKPFINSNYSLQITKELGSNAASTANYEFTSSYILNSKTTTSFQVKMTSNNRLSGYDWQASGYIR